MTSGRVSALYMGAEVEGLGGHQDVTSGHMFALYAGAEVEGFGGHQDMTSGHICALYVEGEVDRLDDHQVSRPHGHLWVEDGTWGLVTTMM